MEFRTEKEAEIWLSLVNSGLRANASAGTCAREADLLLQAYRNRIAVMLRQQGVPVPENGLSDF